MADDGLTDHKSALRQRAWLLLPAAALYLVSTVAQADIYKKVDSNGITHLTDRPQGAGWKLVMRTKPVKRAGVPVRKSEHPNKARLGPLIEQVAQDLRIDLRLIHAVIETESNYDPDAVSRAGAIGLMQLMPGTAERYGVSDPRDPSQNLYGGARYLRDLLLQFRNLTLALAAYNAGENAVIRHGLRIPPFPETQNYVRKVLTRYRRLPTS